MKTLLAYGSVFALFGSLRHDAPIIKSLVDAELAKSSEYMRFSEARGTSAFADGSPKMDIPNNLAT